MDSGQQEGSLVDKPREITRLSKFQIHFVFQRLHNKTPNSVSFCYSAQVPSGHYSQTQGRLLYQDIKAAVFLSSFYHLA